jgi:hypothetical protein
VVVEEVDMRVRVRVGFFVFVWMFLVFCVSGVVVSRADVGGSLVWEAQVSSSGVEVVSPVLRSGVNYGVVVNDSWVYDVLANLGADAEYYTTDYHDTWMWGNYYELPNGESFLQIDRLNVDLGPFSNGDTGHTYVTYLVGEGKSLGFRIYDWLDGNYSNNSCHLTVQIYEECTVGGRVVDPDAVNVSLMVGVPLLAVVLAVHAVLCYKKRLSA